MKTLPTLFVECVLPETEGFFHYHLPPSLSRTKISPGARFVVPFGRTWKIAYVIRCIKKPDVKTTKAVLACLDEESLFMPALFKLLCWIAEYYQTPLGKVLKCALPQGMHIVPRRRFSLSNLEKAEAFLGRSSSGSAVIRLLMEKGALGERDIRKSLGSGLGRVFYDLKKKGLLEETWEMSPPSVKPKLEKKIVLNISKEEAVSMATLLEKKAPRQAEAIRQLLLSGGALMTKDFQLPVRQAVTSLIEKKIVIRKEEQVLRRPFVSEGFLKKSAIVLNPNQAQVLKTIKAALQERAFAPFLLHGVTGSGKTEIYFNAIREVIERGEGAILLLPEIGLTASIAVRFQEHFGDKVALLHSGLSAGERFDEWQRIREGKAPLVIGVRSAVFAPLKKTGIVIVDEEHDPSYRQDEGARYHGRDVALMRGRDEKCVVILGSATPSFESYFNAEQGKYHKLCLPHRIDKRVLPTVRLVNMKDHSTWVHPFVSRALYDAIRQRIADKEQALLFVNRRGFSPLILCRDCGFTPSCRHCSVTLTFHKVSKQLVCHYCGLRHKPPGTCPQCQSTCLNAIGIGTEQIEETVRKLFPEVRLARLDRDTTQKKGAHQNILSAMTTENLDVLIGTQMIAKGHDFPKVTLVGVISADMSLHVPDFRSSERTFQLLAQVAGRSGRGEIPGEVIVQTMQVDDETIQAAASQDFVQFYKNTIVSRKQLRYPPFCRLALIVIRHRVETVAISCAEMLVKSIRLAISGGSVSVLGPAPAPLLRLRGWYRYQVLLKGDDQKQIARVLKSALSKKRDNWVNGLKLDIEIDPQQFV